MHEFIKVRPCDMTVDREYQRELKESRIKKMAAAIDYDRLGVPVLSKRANGEMVILDGQHRVFALMAANLDTDPILCEVHNKMARPDEAALFLKLNSERRAVGVYDKWRARITARDPLALEIRDILDALNLRISKAVGRNCISAIQAVESVHVGNGNLKHTLAILKRWSDGVTPEAFDGVLIRCMSQFVKDHPEHKPSEMVARLEPIAPARVINRIKRAQGSDPDVPKMTAAVTVLREIYNTKNRNKLQAPKPALNGHAVEAQASA
jgi:ParB-like nuclease domain